MRSPHQLCRLRRRESRGLIGKSSFLERRPGPGSLIRERAIGQSDEQQSRHSLGSEINPFAADAAAILPANTSLARLLASHIFRDGEMVLLILRPSLWFILLSSLRFVAGALVLIFALHFLSATSSHNTVRSLVEFGVSAITARLMWATLQWMSRLYILTDLRILSVAGVFNVDIFDCPLRKVARTRVIRSSQERFTNSGSIEIIPQDDTLPFGLWLTIAQPVVVHEQIVATISRAKQGGMGPE